MKQAMRFALPYGLTMMVLAFILASCIPGINTDEGVEATIERTPTGVVQGTLVLPVWARNVLFQFHTEEGEVNHEKPLLSSGAHSFVIAAEGAVSCHASGFLEGERYFILPCSTRETDGR